MVQVAVKIILSNEVHVARLALVWTRGVLGVRVGFEMLTEGAAV